MIADPAGANARIRPYARGFCGILTNADFPLAFSMEL